MNSQPADGAVMSRMGQASGRRRWLAISVSWADVRRRLFGSWWETLITLACLGFLGWAAFRLVRWGLIDSIWKADQSAACHDVSGACWSVIHARYRLILFGLYPFEEHWRSALACVVAIGMVVLSCVGALRTPGRLLVIWGGGSLAFFVLMYGGILGLTPVPTDKWGGLVLTLFVFICTVLISIPGGIAIALALQSKLPVIRGVTLFCIDVVRSIPLVSVVFAVAFFAPFVLPSGLTGDKIYRVIIGYAFFFACLQAVVIAGGLQSIPPGQHEAADALGLRRWQVLALIILPQALKITLPSTINLIVMAFKDTSVLVIVGLFELTSSGNIAYQSGEWSDFYVEVLVFVAAIYFVFAYSLSRYGAYIERTTRTGLD
jgi:general L-amino acid transport system permease protein